MHLDVCCTLFALYCCISYSFMFYFFQWWFAGCKRNIKFGSCTSRSITEKLRLHSQIPALDFSAQPSSTGLSIVDDHGWSRMTQLEIAFWTVAVQVKTEKDTLGSYSTKTCNLVAQAMQWQQHLSPKMRTMMTLGLHSVIKSSICHVKSKVLFCSSATY